MRAHVGQQRDFVNVTHPMCHAVHDNDARREYRSAQPGVARRDVI